MLGPLAMLAVGGLWLLPMLWLVDASGDAEHRRVRNEILYKQTGGALRELVAPREAPLVLRGRGDPRRSGCRS